MSKQEITKIIKDLALRKGFDLVGVSPASKNNSNYLDEWLSKGYHASMSWIEKRKDERDNIFNYFPEVKSVISFGYNYYSGENDLHTKKNKISNYAWGEDYHVIIKKELFDIVNNIKKYKDNFKFRVCVDTSPILEKKWGQKSGIGWIGKHTNLINDKIGSWFFLAEILLDFELEYDEPFYTDLCGTCTKCIDECPTQAIVEDYVLDANKCISYLTIEHKGNLPEKYENDLNDWIFGCDICQQVCPWNIKFSKKTEDSRFIIREKIKKMTDKQWEKITEEKFESIFKKSNIKRTKYKGLVRNINANKNNL